MGKFTINTDQKFYISSHSVLDVLGEPCTSHLHVCKEAKK